MAEAIIRKNKDSTSKKEMLPRIYMFHYQCNVIAASMDIEKQNFTIKTEDYKMK